MLVDNLERTKETGQISAEQAEEEFSALKYVLPCYFNHLVESVVIGESMLVKVSL